MKSAEGLVWEIDYICNAPRDYAYNSRVKEAAALIRTRDKEIVEACKKALATAFSRSIKGEYGLNVYDALDSVLGTLG